MLAPDPLTWGADMAKKKTGFALMNPKKPLGIGVPLLASAVWGVAALSPLPGDGVLFGIGAFATWAKYFGDRGVTFGGSKSNPRKNPLPLVALSAPLLFGAAAAGTAGLAYYYFKERKEVVERRATADEVIADNPFFRFVTPTVGFAAGALIGAVRGAGLVSGLKGGLLGMGLGFGLRRLVREVMYIQVGAASKAAQRLDDAGIIDVEAMEIG